MTPTAGQLVPNIRPIEITINTPSPWLGQTFTVNIDETIGFLARLRNVWQLFAIDPLARDLFGFTADNGKRIPVNTRGGTFTQYNARAAAIQILDWQRMGLNVYVHVNPFDPEKKKPNARTGKISGKHRADRQSITEVEYAHADVDPVGSETPEQVVARVKGRLVELKIVPTFLVQSGRGCHVWLRYASPLTDIKRAEDLNQRLCASMGVDMRGKDPCWNVDRVLKIAGCLSFPGATKKNVPVLPVTLLEGSNENV